MVVYTVYTDTTYFTYAILILWYIHTANLTDSKGYHHRNRKGVRIPPLYIHVHHLYVDLCNIVTNVPSTTYAVSVIFFHQLASAGYMMSIYNPRPI